MTINQAQANMRDSYFGGAPGLLVSGLVWTIAGLVAAFSGAQSAVIALLIGGMVIHPGAVGVSQLLGRPGAHTKGNPLGALALESTVILLLGIALAFALSRWRLELFFPAMLLVIGGRYLTFQTLYGSRTYWLCGGALAALGFAAALLKFPVAATAGAGGLLELVFAAVVFRQVRGESQPVATAA